jgi:hypothetical protein
MNNQFLATYALILMAAFQFGFAIHKPDPWNCGCTVMICFLVLRAILMDAAREVRPK